MPFLDDRQLIEEAGNAFGEYLKTFTSHTGQVRADLFRVGSVVNVHVSLRRGLSAADVTDPYLSELRAYAKQHGFAGQLRLIYSQ